MTERIVIAEFCQNHNGQRAVLQEMVWAAAAAGATYAKIQSMRADDLTFRPQFEEGLTEDGRIIAIKRPYAPEYARLKPLDLSDEDHVWFGDECRRAGIKPLTTVFSRSRVPFVATLGWDAVKVASYDCGSLPLLRDLMGHFPHLFISTGATYDQEVAAAAALLQGHSFSFLHCVTKYPTPLAHLNLARLNWLRQFTPSVGFSDHTLVARDGIQGSVMAMALGAQVIERHFTVLEPSQTKDGPVSIGPDLLKRLVEMAHWSQPELERYVEQEMPERAQMMGRAQRALDDDEQLNRDYYRGRFASKVDGQIVYNWQEVALA